jgi:hypothetical protein
MNTLDENIYYIKLMNNHIFKSMSLEDNIYFTIRDIFINAECTDYCFEANNFNKKLTDGISFEDRDSTFKYTDILNNKDYVDSLKLWLSRIDKSTFVLIKFKNNFNYNYNYDEKFNNDAKYNNDDGFFNTANITQYRYLLDDNHNLIDKINSVQYRYVNTTEYNNYYLPFDIWYDDFTNLKSILDQRI